MGNRNTSWVRDRLHVTFGNAVKSTKLGALDDDLWVYFSDECLLEAFDSLFGGKTERSKLLSDAECENYLSWVSAFIHDQYYYRLFDAYDKAEWDESKISWAKSDFTLMALPIRCESCGITTGKEKVNYTFMFLVDVPTLYVNGERVTSPLGGMYSNCDDLLLIDASGSSEMPTSCFHEMVHYLVRRYLDDVNIRDVMYGANEADQREELMTHFFTDNHVMVDALYEWFKRCKLNRSKDGTISSISAPILHFSYGDASDGSADCFKFSSATSARKCETVGSNPSVVKGKKSKNLTIADKHDVHDFLLSNEKVRSIPEKFRSWSSGFSTVMERSKLYILANGGLYGKRKR